jgi:hypothetical protein
MGIIMIICAIMALATTIYFYINFSGLDLLMVGLFGLSIFIGTILNSKIQYARYKSIER